MIKLNSIQNLVIHKKKSNITIIRHLNILNQATLETLPIYLQQCTTNGILLELQDRLEKIKNEQIRNELNKTINEYIKRMNNLQHAHDKNEVKEYLRNISFEEFKRHLTDLQQKDIELTEQGIEVAKEINEMLVQFSNSLERISLKSGKTK